jgi:hypothetical protein
MKVMPRRIPSDGKFTAGQKSVSRIFSHIFFLSTDGSPGVPKQQFDRSTKVGIPKEVIPAAKGGILCTSASGVLFENALWVGVKHEYVVHRRISVFFGNLRRRLTNFRAIIEEVDHLRVRSKVHKVYSKGEDGGCTVRLKRRRNSSDH